MSIEKAVADQVKASVETTIRVQIAEALSKNPGDLVKYVVDQAMKEKPNSYSPSYFSAAVNKMIHDTAKEEFKVWLEDHKTLIRKAIQIRMKEEGAGFIGKVADQIIDGLSKNFSCYVNLKVED